MSNAHTFGPVTVHIGEALSVLRTLPSESVHCVVTSPPYWGLRDYGASGQLGLEPTPEQYVEHLVEVFREVRRVLRRDGTCWLNLGDSYAAAASGRTHPNDAERPEQDGNFRVPSLEAREERWKPKNYPGRAPAGLKPKDLVGIPWMVAFALRADGWWLRRDVIWAKPNPMPESVTDRPTSSHEYLFLLTRSERYYYDADAVREAHSHSTLERWNGIPTRTNPSPQIRQVGTLPVNGENSFGSNPNGRNLRSVWTIATQPYPDAHFATFPEDLVIPCVKAGTSEHGVCAECGAPWERVVEREAAIPQRKGGVKTNTVVGNHRDLGHGRAGGFYPNGNSGANWRLTCSHDAQPVPALVLDPFAGSGTTLSVARRLGRRAVGIELQADYLPLIEQRVEGRALPLLEAFAEV